MSLSDDVNKMARDKAMDKIRKLLAMATARDQEAAAEAARV